MLPVIGRPCEGPSRHAVIGTAGWRQLNMAQTSGCFSVERNVRFLCDPDTMEQNGKLAGDSDDGSVA